METIVMLDPTRVPRHIGIIMDGNGRWARAHGLPRIVGHERGIEALRRTVEHCGRRGVNTITAYAFSSENWKRPQDEVDGLFELFVRFLIAERERLLKDEVRLTAVGRRDRFPKDVCRELELTEQATAHFEKHLRLAVDYGGRAEIAATAQRLAQRCLDGTLRPEEIDEAQLDAEICNDIPDPDLIIRTANEQRLSNFLLWQSCYSELYFSTTLWPDFGPADVDAALADFARRERRYGGRPQNGSDVPGERVQLSGSTEG
jgi:undecaprenyl diphosphate synthase